MENTEVHAIHINYLYFNWINSYLNIPLKHIAFCRYMFIVTSDHMIHRDLTNDRCLDHDPCSATNKAACKIHMVGENCREGLFKLSKFYTHTNGHFFYLIRPFNIAELFKRSVQANAEEFTKWITHDEKRCLMLQGHSFKFISPPWFVLPPVLFFATLPFV